MGERSKRIGPVDGRQLIRCLGGLLLTGWVLTAGASVRAEPVTVGPGRIVCNAAFCQLGSGARPKERFRVIVSDLPLEEIRRLRKCTGVAKPCVVMIEGTDQGNPMRIMATAIHWQEDPPKE